MDEMTYRAAVPEDVPALTELYSAHCAELKSYGLQYDVNAEALPDVVATRVRSRMFLVGVAECGGRAAGFVMCSVLRIGREYLCKGAGAVGYLNDIYVSPEFRRRGAAGRLMALARSWLAEQGITALELQVLGANAAGRAFWQKQGFRENGIFCCADID